MNRELSARAIWLFSGWIGFVCGLMESVVHLAWRAIEHRVGTPDLWVNWQSPWMAPIGLGLWLGGVGLLASLLNRAAPRAVAVLLPGALIGLGAWSIFGAIGGLYPWAVNLVALGLAVRLGPRVRFDSPKFRRAVRASWPCAVALWLVFFLTTGLWPAIAERWALTFGPRPSTNAPHVLLVVWDTVRADNLSLYGYERPTSPRLEEWARRGLTFSQARSTTPFTLGTHASLFTGHWMSQTSARVNVALDGQRPTIAEHLRDRGYATGGFVGNIFYGSAHYGLDRGFLRYHDIPGNITRRATPRELLRSCRLGASLITWLERKWRLLAPMQRLRLDAGELNREALAWIDQTRTSGRPFFLFMNYFDAHSPYSLPGEAPQPYSRLTSAQLEALLKKLQAVESQPGREAEAAKLRNEYNARVRDAYDDGIAWIDRKFDELLRQLEDRGLLRDTLVIVTADHGEMLGEHGLMGHGEALNRQAVHVPLLAIGPRSMGIPQGETIKQAVSVRDVPATILDLVGDPEPQRFPGQSLSRFWGDRDGPDADASAGPVLSEMEHMPWMPRSPRTPAASGPLWLLTERGLSYHRQDHESLGVQERLFDLNCDPGEKRDLARDPARRAALDALRARFAEVRHGDQ